MPGYHVQDRVRFIFPFLLVGWLVLVFDSEPGKTSRVASYSFLEYQFFLVPVVDGLVKKYMSSWVCNKAYQFIQCSLYVKK